MKKRIQTQSVTKKLTLKENLEKKYRKLLDTGKITAEDLKKLRELTPDPKYMNWVVKVWIQDKPNINDLRNTLTEFDTFAARHRGTTSDIYTFKTFDDLKKYINELNAKGDNLSLKDLESDYDTILDNNDLLVMSPHTHEASRKLGLSYFSYRDCGDGKKDSSWCTTFKSPDHFNSYYYSKNITFYYVRVKSKSYIKKLEDAFGGNYRPYMVTAICVYDDGKMEGYTGEDHLMDNSSLKKYLNIIGLS